MIGPEEIASSDDPRLGPFLDIRDGALLRRGDPLFIAESRMVVEQVAALGMALRTLLVLPSRVKWARELVARTEPAHTEILVADPDLMKRITGYPVHRGVLAAVERPRPLSMAEVSAGARVVLVLEDLTDQENVGSLFRSAAAFGADAVLLSPRCVDPLFRRCVRVSMGHSLTVPFARCDPWPDALTTLAADGFELIALDPAPGATPLADFTPASRSVALVVGTEGSGLSSATRATASRRVVIPIAAGVDSLNVGVAGAIALHHLDAATGQRAGSPSHVPVEDR